MPLNVDYKEGTWYFVVTKAHNRGSFEETFEADSLEEAEEYARSIMTELIEDDDDDLDDLFMDED